MDVVGETGDSVGRHAATPEPLHVLYVGSSADLGALRRLMEAHGAVTRSRLTPGVTVVIADSSVPADHPMVRGARSLGIPVMEPAEAIAQYANWRTRAEPPPPTPKARRPWPFRWSGNPAE
ncbi:MAG TPA: BRCT domain-containing protein [Pseudonocardiaceae bacterium]|nr:BRCT domain-containing protein [Pseudonocardiaceae bacterium]